MNKRLVAVIGVVALIVCAVFGAGCTSSPSFNEPIVGTWYSDWTSSIITIDEYGTMRDSGTIVTVIDATKVPDKTFGSVYKSANSEYPRLAYSNDKLIVLNDNGKGGVSSMPYKRM